ncbi:MAG TPA: Asp-tRNA(Asn)/Glu-tRNA(Gln) amidotransferase GatCAB subunit C [Bacteroidetes bacterium]|nr:Asp-tRNA(Asn)/Glu-tRNA(Gln) amidotransferase GatCAB subunit C [Bacteroidota bacterium]
MEINNEMIDHLAHLSRLEFDENSKKEIKKDLQNIIGFVEKINELPLDEVQPLIYITEEKNVLRNDEILATETVSKSEALKNVPLKDSDYIKVPKVLKTK